MEAFLSGLEKGVKIPKHELTSKQEESLIKELTTRCKRLTKFLEFEFNRAPTPKDEQFKKKFNRNMSSLKNLFHIQGEVIQRARKEIKRDCLDCLSKGDKTAKRMIDGKEIKDMTDINAFFHLFSEEEQNQIVKMIGENKLALLAERIFRDQRFIFLETAGMFLDFLPRFKSSSISNIIFTESADKYFNDLAEMFGITVGFLMLQNQVHFQEGDVKEGTGLDSSFGDIDNLISNALQDPEKFVNDQRKNLTSLSIYFRYLALNPQTKKMPFSLTRTLGKNFNLRK